MKTRNTIALVAVALFVQVSFVQVVSAQPNYLALSAERYQAGHYQESIDAAQAVLRTNPNSAAAYNNMSVAYLALKKYDQAIATAQQALRVDPKYSLAGNNLAWAKMEKAKASGAAGMPANLAPSADNYVAQSLQAFRNGRYEECISKANSALRLKPADAEAFNNLGACSASLGKWDDAIRYERQALRLKPDFQLAKNNLAWAQEAKAGKK
jgi:protein O-mannosyl-transferase